MTLLDELDAHLTYLEERGFVFDDIARDALFAQLAEERGITAKEVNDRLVNELLISLRKIANKRKTS
jgi:hypothetical protein